MDASKKWLGLFVWTVFVRFWLKANRCLPVPCKENIPALFDRLNERDFLLRPGTRFYRDILDWIYFLARDYPSKVDDVFFCLQSRRKDDLRRPNWFTNTSSILTWLGQWNIDVIEVLANTGRVNLLNTRLQHFWKRLDFETQRQKIWEWSNDIRFSKPSTVRTLLYIATKLIDPETGNYGIRFKNMLKSKVVVMTHRQIVSWLCRKLVDSDVLSIGRTRNPFEMSRAIRETPRFKSLDRLNRFQSVVRLVIFFYRYVTLENAGKSRRGTCPICWESKILRPLHDDIRHGICNKCIRRLTKNNLLNRCPTCRVALRN